VLFLRECLLLFISLSTQSGNFSIHPRKILYAFRIFLMLPTCHSLLILFDLIILETHGEEYTLWSSNLLLVRLPNILLRILFSDISMSSQHTDYSSTLPTFVLRRETKLWPILESICQYMPRMRSIKWPSLRAPVCGLGVCEAVTQTVNGTWEEVSNL
jgi:hypothetical protein